MAEVKRSKRKGMLIRHTKELFGRFFLILIMYLHIEVRKFDYLCLNSGKLIGSEQ